jgi:hypothetical protein
MRAAPSDLAVTFRSIPRRVREAQGDTPAEVVGSQLRRIDELVADSARALHCPADPAAIADVIEDRPADEWENELLDQLTASTLEIGAVLRMIATAAEPPDND